MELFAGTRSIGKAFESRGHEVFSVEWSKDFENIDLYEDINKVTAEDIIRLFGKPDVIWASPDCSTFSIAAISHHRRKNPDTGSLEPVSTYAKFCDMVDQHVLKLIEELQPRYYFIENPRGGMRKMEWMKGLPRYTVTYCQYGDNRMKPTDIWTPCGDDNDINLAKEIAGTYNGYSVGECDMFSDYLLGDQSSATITGRCV